MAPFVEPCAIRYFVSQPLPGAWERRSTYALETVDGARHEASWAAWREMLEAVMAMIDRRLVHRHLGVELDHKGLLMEVIVENGPAEPDRSDGQIVEKHNRNERDEVDVMAELAKIRDQEQEKDLSMTFVLIDDVAAAFEILLEVVERECDKAHADTVRAVGEDILAILNDEWDEGGFVAEVES